MTSRSVTPVLAALAATIPSADTLLAKHRKARPSKAKRKIRAKAKRRRHLAKAGRRAARKGRR